MTPPKELYFTTLSVQTSYNVSCFNISASSPPSGGEQDSVCAESALQNHSRRNVRYLRQVRSHPTNKSVSIITCNSKTHICPMYILKDLTVWKGL